MSENANPYPDELKAMHVALAKAQGEFPTITKDKTAQAGSYSYEYADLATILAGVRPVLAKHGLALIQRLENLSGGGPSIRTELRHADGGVIASSFPLGEWTTMQQLGSSSTYIRRYALCAMLGIAAEEEDDGRLGAAVSPHGSSATSSAEESPFQPPDLPEGREHLEDLSAAQRRKIFSIKTKLTNAGVFTDEEFKAQLGMSFNGKTSVTELTKEEASDLIGRLLKAEKKLDLSEAEEKLV